DANAGSRQETGSFNRRSSARASLFVPVRIDGSSEVLWAHDISLGGLQCTTKTPRWPGTYVDIELELPDVRETVRAGAQVVSLDKRGSETVLGLRFCRLPSGAEMAIYRFLDRRRILWD